MFLVLLAIVLFLGTGEAALRIIYRDEGRTTLGGPGPRAFIHDLVQGGELRGRLDRGPKTPGVPRIMALGDSITWGMGVRDWRKTWPEQLVLALERAGTPHQMAVLALHGRGVPEHVIELDRWAAQVNPDIIIYQWYCNDIEVIEHRPPTEHWWERWPTHKPLRANSYLYYFLDNRIAGLWPVKPTYQDYLVNDFLPGSLEWAEFERHFHTLSERAAEVAPRRIMFLYPQVPYHGAYPLESLHARMRAMAAPHPLSIPPKAWLHPKGTVTDRPDAAWGQAVQFPAAADDAALTTRVYYLRPGVASFTIWLQVSPGQEAPVGALSAIDAATSEQIASAGIPTDPGQAGWQQVKVAMSIPGPKGHAVNLVFRKPAGSTPTLASIDLDVNYGWQVVDLAEPLNTFDTHASLFDSHPNERAHLAIAQILLDAIKSRP